ncbi:MAG: SDR family NAD(P)-dependent oxidoreductase [Ilumatobacteraceae bacterium]
MAEGASLSGKVALITGGARGQGAAEGKLLAEAGATVILADVLDADGAATAAAIGARYVHLDVTSEEEWETVVADIVATDHRLDVLVNNAGILRAAVLVKETLAQWEQVLAVNQTGVFLGMRTAARAMIAAGNGGSIVNISSVAGLCGTFGSTSYSASKWAVRGMTKVAAKELGRYGIRVNSIHPGIIETDMIADFPEMHDDERRRRTERSTPLQRLGVPEDVARVVLFLAGDGAGYCTGQEFTVDGGMQC